MTIELHQLGKRFQRDWIFRNISETFPDDVRCAVRGGNGSGKSTLLQVISGFLTPSEGSIVWKKNGTAISVDDVYKSISIASPFLSLYDDLTLDENVSFFLHFKSFRNNLSIDGFSDVLRLSTHRNKALKFYSSGMRQRVKLGLAILADTPILLLDEPVSHLDHEAIKWFQELLAQHLNGRMLFVASNNNDAETFLCSSNLVVDHFKANPVLTHK